MLRKMYLVPAERFNKEGPKPPHQKSNNIRVMHKHPPPPKARKPRKQKKPIKRHITKHSYPDKWLMYRKKMQEEKMRNNMLIKTISQFLRKVLPATGALASERQQMIPTKLETPKSETPKRTSARLPVRSILSSASSSGTPAAEHWEAGPSTESVYETTTPPPPSHAAMSEEDVKEFTTRHFGPTASPYMTSYVYDKDFLDKHYGIRKEGEKYKIGDSAVTIDTNSDIYVKRKRFAGTEGLWELLTKKKPNVDIVTSDDYRQYKGILEMTNAHLEGYMPGGNIHISRGFKYKEIISKLFAPTRSRGAESALRKRWA
jgi:hypothetical protein